jgi:hypothetical protein
MHLIGHCPGYLEFDFVKLLKVETESLQIRVVAVIAERVPTPLSRSWIYRVRGDEAVFVRKDQLAADTRG